MTVLERLDWRKRLAVRLERDSPSAPARDRQGGRLYKAIQAGKRREESQR